jgi:hypothetical protein
MNYIKLFLTKQIDKAGVFGMGCLIFTWIDIVSAFIFAFEGNISETIQNVLLGLTGIICYYFSCYVRDKRL